MKLIFVYGTLKRHGTNHRFLAGQHFLGAAHTAPGYTLYSLGEYPGMIRTPNATDVVTGEVWNVDDTGLEKLDQLEGVNQGLYAREAIALTAPFADQPVETYIYLQSLEGRTAIGATWTV